MFIYYIFVCLIIFCITYWHFLRKINTSEFVKIIQKNNTKKIIKSIKRVKNINDSIVFKTTLLPKNHSIKTKMINESIEFKTSFINIEKATPLMIAIIYNTDITVIEELIKYGADVNIHDENLNTAFLYAALYYRNSHIFDLLINYGADKNTKNILGANAVIVAIYNNDISILSKIIDLGININYQNRGGWSPLMSIALDFRSIEMARLLVQKGADVSLKNKIGKTALDIAKEFNNTEMINFLNSI